MENEIIIKLNNLLRVIVDKAAEVAEKSDEKYKDLQEIALKDPNKDNIDLLDTYRKNNVLKHAIAKYYAYHINKIIEHSMSDIDDMVLSNDFENSLNYLKDFYIDDEVKLGSKVPESLGSNVSDYLGSNVADEEDDASDSVILDRINNYMLDYISEFDINYSDEGVKINSKNGNLEIRVKSVGSPVTDDGDENEAADKEYKIGSVVSDRVGSTISDKVGSDVKEEIGGDTPDYIGSDIPDKIGSDVSEKESEDNKKVRNKRIKIGSDINDSDESVIGSTITDNDNDKNHSNRVGSRINDTKIVSTVGSDTKE